MKKFLLAIFIAVLFGTLIVYNQEETPKNIEKKVETNVLTKISDNLYEGTFDKLDYETAAEFFKNKYMGQSGCTVIYKDGMVLRNFDWSINMNGNGKSEPSTIIIHTTADKGRYATVGVGMNPALNEQNYQSLTEKELAVLPFMTLDIMNSEGLMVAESSVPGVDKISNTDGKQGKEKTYAQYILMRGIADHCKNVDEAIKYMENINFYALDLGYGDRREEVHFMVADKKEVAIIEYIDNQMHVLRKSDMDGETWMTNHYRFNGKNKDTGHGMGFERDEIIRDNYASVVDSKSGMDLLNKIRYTKSYTLDPADEEHFWWSEYSGYYDTDGDGVKEFNFNRETPHNDPKAQAIIKGEIQKYHSKDNALSWWTDHSTVFNTKDMSMLMCIHEQFDQLYSFKIKQENQSKFPSIITIKASEQSALLRDKIFAKYQNDVKSDEEALNEFNNQFLPILNARTEQEFPKVQTKNKLEKEVYKYGDVYTLTGEKQDKIVFYIHGGAWVWEIDKSHVEFCDQLVDTLNAKVYMPIYPLAPQASYKEGYQMIEQVYDELVKQNKPIIIMGDSAGGTMTLGFVLKLKEKGKKLPDKIIVLSPSADSTFTSPEMMSYQKNDGYLSRVQCLESVKLWAKGADLKLPELSPLFGNYKGFPKTLMFIADRDLLEPDELKLYEKMRESGVDISLVKGEGLWHVFPVSHIEEQAQSINLIKSFSNQN